MDDLVKWFGAQLDEDERIARAASWTDDANAWHAEPSPFGARDAGQRWYIEDAIDDGVVSHVDPAASDHEGVARHIAEWDPARVLREIDSKRRVLGVYASALKDRAALRDRMREVVDSDPDEFYRLHRQESDLIGRARQLGPIVRLLALPYADRPGYLDDWRL
ncbi:DUF6221 family protein [Streptomyces sp. NPDC007148]|uniref:DUF6221 family protein n=1 Tax=Streptomyces sp. NPDC007148 TaxID=3364775 RepID=UPI0036C4470F